MDHEEKILSLLEKVARKVDGIETRLENMEVCFEKLEVRFDNLEVRFDRLEEKVDRIEEDLNSVKGIVMTLENGLNSKVGILFDGHAAGQEKLRDHDEKIVSLQDSVETLSIDVLHLKEA